MTPKNATTTSKVQKIACASVYCKPNSKTKTDLHDHLAEAYNLLSTKYKKGLHFIIAGDTNDLNLTPVLNLSKNLVQIVKKPTRKDPSTGVESMLDPVITTLTSYYQTQLCLPPLDPDPDTDGKPSDHRIVVVRPITSIDNKCARSTKTIKFRPITDLGMLKYRKWLTGQDWSEVYEVETPSEKAQTLQTILFQSFQKFFPEKTLGISSDDQPWITHKQKYWIDKEKGNTTHIG